MGVNQAETGGYISNYSQTPVYTGGLKIEVIYHTGSSTDLSQAVVPPTVGTNHPYVLDLEM